MRLFVYRTLPIALLWLSLGGCQRPGYSFRTSAAPAVVVEPTPVRPDAVQPVPRLEPASSSYPAPRQRLVVGHRPGRRPTSTRFHPVKPLVMSQQNTQAEPISEDNAPQRRPHMTENQLLALALLGGGGALTTAGLLLIFAVGGVGAIIAGVLLGLVGLGMIWGWLYLRGLARAYQH